MIERASARLVVHRALPSQAVPETERAKRRKMQDAIHAHRCILDICDMLSDYIGKITTLNNLAGVTINPEDLDATLDYLERALLLTREHHCKGFETVILSHIGKVYRIQGDLDSAIAHFEKALEIQVGTRARRSEAQTRFCLAQALEGRKRLDKASNEINRELGGHTSIAKRGHFKADFCEARDPSSCLAQL